MIDSVEPNKIYKIGTGITGIRIDKDNITPFPEMEIFDLGINVDVASWEEVNVTPIPQ